MKPIAMAALAAVIAAGAGTAALAQYRDDPDATAGVDANSNPNVEAYREYQDQRGVYDDQRDVYARQRGAYDDKAMDYRTQRRDYEQRLRDYDRARADYDREYGPDAYERYYPGPPPPD
ncbi:MAG: hypothetical protein ABI376_09275 [Caulobacteraceae bacterium]